MISSRFRLGVNGDESARDGNCRLGFTVVLVSVGLIVSANPLANHDSDLVVIGCGHSDRAACIDHLQACSGWEGLLQVIVEVITLTEDAVEIAVVKIELIVQPGPVHAFELAGDEAEDDDHDDQEDTAGADSSGASAFALGALVLNQLDDAPEDQEHWPVI